MVNNKRTISFNEELHRYTDEYNNVYTSVTTVIQNYYPKFNEDYWAGVKAKEYNISKEAVLKIWANGRDAACAKGTIEHKLLEDSVINSRVKPEGISLFPKGFIKGQEKLDVTLLASSPLALKYPKILFKLMEFIDAGYTVYVEKRVYWAEFLIAGTIDCLLVKNGKFWILDWKTNKDELKFKSGYYKKINGIKTNQWVDKKEYFFSPLDNLENCKGTIYTMQLSLYAYLLELWGLQCEGLIIYHIRDVPALDNENKVVYDANKNIVMKKILTDYKIPYLKQSCELLTIDHKNALNGINTNKTNNNLTINFGIT